MELIPMEYGAKYTVAESPVFHVKMDHKRERIQISNKYSLYLNNIEYVQKFQVGYNKVKTRLFKEDEYGPLQYLNVIAFRRRNGAWVFLCDSKELFLCIAKEFVETYYVTIIERSHDKTERKTKWGSVKYNVNRFYEEIIQNYDSRREFFKYLLKAAKGEIEKGNFTGSCIHYVQDVEREYHITGCRLNIEDDNLNYVEANIEDCLIFEKFDYAVFCDEISKFLPENIKETRRKEKIKEEYGKDFVYRGEVIENYRKLLQDLTLTEILLKANEVQTRIDKCSVGIDKYNEEIEKFSKQIKSIERIRDVYTGKIPLSVTVNVKTENEKTDFVKKTEPFINHRLDDFVRQSIERKNQEYEKRAQEKITDIKSNMKKIMEEKKFEEEYREVLLEKKKSLETECYDKISQELKRGAFDPESETKCKRKLCDQLIRWKTPGYGDLEVLYEDYHEQERRLEAIMKNSFLNADEFNLSRHIEFYHLGKILISSCLNRITGDFTKSNQIVQDKLDQAMMYFYETDTPQEAYRQQKEMEYLDNRKKGEKGEAIVNYELMWLDEKEYIIIPKTPSKMHTKEIMEIRISDSAHTKFQEYDHIVVGKKGIFVIETKYYKGKIIIDSKGNWFRKKEGGICEAEKDPASDVDKKVKLMRSFLNKGIPVMGIICIAYPKAVIEGEENCSFQVVRSDKLIRTIENWPMEENGQTLSDEEMRECVTLIEKHRI